jgi:hypothetical protein
MKQLPFLTTSLFAFFISQAQSDSITSVKKQKTFNTSIRTLDHKMINGRLYAINDSQVVLLKSGNKYQYISAENIKSFSLKRKNSVLKGALIGFGAGAITGIIIGLASGDDPVMEYPDPSTDPFLIGSFVTALNNSFAMTAGEKAVGGGLALGASGAIIGTIIGAVAKKKFIIGGKKEKFHDLQAELMQRLIVK